MFNYGLPPSLFSSQVHTWCPSTAVTLSSSGSWRAAWTGPSPLLPGRATGWMWAGLFGFSVFFTVLIVVFNDIIAFCSGQIDLTELLQGSEVVTDGPRKATCVWRDAYFTLKYYSDALFDFPHWFGFSKRAFKVNVFPFLLPLRAHAGSYLTFFFPLLKLRTM